MPNRDDSILIVGGGIGGMSAALALSRIGRPVTLFEQAKEFREIGAGIQIGPNAFHMFQELGISDSIRKLAAFPDALVVMDSLSGRQLTEIAVGAAFRERFGNPYGLIHRADLHGLLFSRCKESSLITLRAAKTVTDFECSNDQVEAIFEDGDSCLGSALVGADGLWSTTRSRLLNDGPPRVSGHVAYRAVLPINEVPQVNRRNAMTVWLGPKTHLVHYPIRNGQLYNLVAVFHSDRYERGWNSYGDPNELEERFSGCRPEVTDILAKIETWRMWVLCDREPVSQWCRGRATLLGDAAHPMLQYMAQGAAMAIEDSVCLANQVADTSRSIEQAFIDYQRIRYLRTTRVQVMARLYGEVFHATDATRDLRNAFLNARSQEDSYASFDWLYNPAEVAKSVFPHRTIAQGTIGAEYP